MSLSKDLTQQFKEKQESLPDPEDISFSVMVLGTNFWPLAPPTHSFNIPEDLSKTYERFQRYYQQKHSYVKSPFITLANKLLNLVFRPSRGRKLTWLWNYSKNELRTNYLNQKYILMTSTYQTAVLVQYNDNDTLSLDELIAATNLPKDTMLQILSVLVKAKILINEEQDQYDLNPSGQPDLVCGSRGIINVPFNRFQVEEDSCQPESAN
jgi:cullin 1